MKKPLVKIGLAVLILSLLHSATALLADETDVTNTSNMDTNFFIGQSSFPKNDSIEITSVERSKDHLTVRGHYTLTSADHALLSLYITTPTAVSVPTDPRQLLKISKGVGDFELTHFNPVPGMPHVSMYSIPGGHAFAGVYFGTKEEAADGSRLDLRYYSDEETSMSGPNKVLLEYLGNPVQVPANMDARYSVEGLTAGVHEAASNAGITIKKLTVDDSEYPYLVGVTCSGSDFPKLKEQFKKMKGYQYNGSIGNDVNKDGSDTCNAFCLIPYQAYPREAKEQIYHRLWLRQQVFYDRVSQ